MDITESKMYKNVVRTYKTDDMENIVNHGCSSGSAFAHIYYKNTCKWYDRYREEIWDLCEDFREETGEKTILSFIGNLNGAENVGSENQFKNLLCWFAVEECCRIYLDSKESE